MRLVLLSYWLSCRGNLTYQLPVGPSPFPSPEGKGSDHRDTPIKWMLASLCPLLVSSLAVTLCDICMPEAFCEFETVRKEGLLNL